MEIVQEIGAYAGFAAVLGLAVLSALYFSQARDLRQLRETIAQGRGRLPDGRPVAGLATMARPAAAQPGRQPTVAPRPAAATGAPVAAAAARPGQVAAPGVAQGAPAGASVTQPPVAQPATAAAAVRPAGLPRVAPPMRPTQGAQPPRGSVLAPGASAAAPRRRFGGLRSLEPRYLALIAAGVLILGGAAAFGATQLLGGDDDAPRAAAGDGPGRRTAQPAGVDPGTVTVSVLNATTVLGLAAQIGDEVESAGFQRGNVTNASDPAEAQDESAVLFDKGAMEEAREVAAALKIEQVKPVDPENKRLAGDASVVVIVGADQTQ
jgi:hypothetical protein